MHLHNISHIRRYLTIDATKALVHAFVTSRLDYGNALLIGLPRDQINKLQRIQNMAARVITFTPRRDHITPVLKDLHWLPVKCRTEYKILSTKCCCQRDSLMSSCGRTLSALSDISESSPFLLVNTSKYNSFLHGLFVGFFHFQNCYILEILFDVP